MTQKIQIKPNEQYLQVEIRENFTPEEAMQFVQQVIDESKKNDLWKILIDCRSFEGDLKIISRYEFGRYVINEKGHPFQIAIVPPEKYIVSKKTLENAAVNWWGITKVTLDIQQALEWLCVKSIDSLTNLP